VTVRSGGAQLARLVDRIANPIAQGWVRSLIDNVAQPAEAKVALERSRTLRSLRHSQTYVDETPLQMRHSSQSSCQN
jgi:hypothetical protein